MINTAMGLKSRPPKLGRLRRIGPRTGSVTRFTRVLMVISMGWGLGPVMGITNDRITRAKIAMVARVKSVLSSPAKSEPLYTCPNWTDFRYAASTALTMAAGTP